MSKSVIFIWTILAVFGVFYPNFLVAPPDGQFLSGSGIRSIKPYLLLENDQWHLEGSRQGRKIIRCWHMSSFSYPVLKVELRNVFHVWSEVEAAMSRCWEGRKKKPGKFKCSTLWQSLPSGQVFRVEPDAGFLSGPRTGLPAAWEIFIRRGCQGFQPKLANFYPDSAEAWGMCQIPIRTCLRVLRGLSESGVLIRPFSLHTASCTGILPVLTSWK
jgi:hypothetical protein